MYDKRLHKVDYRFLINLTPSFRKMELNFVNYFVIANIFTIFATSKR
jgi:hypothetical protein